MINLFDTINIDLKYILLPILYIIIGILVYEVSKRVILNISKKSKLKNRRHQKKADTIREVIINIIKYIIIVFVILAILTVFGVNVSSIIAGLGLTAALLGLALQDLAKDFIAGISIIFEDQFELGDTIEVDGFMGEVVFLGLKTTRIRDYKGATKIISNRNISNVINYNIHNSVAIVDVSVAYEEDCEKVLKVLNKLADDLEGKIPSAKGKMEVWGIDNLDESGVIYRVAQEVSSMEQYTVQRLLRKEIKNTFDKAGIKIPYKQIEVHNGK